MRIYQPVSKAVFTLAFIISLSICAIGAVFPRFAFVANTNDNTVSIYTVNGTSGLLRDDGYVVVGKKPAGTTVTPSGAFLFVTNSGSASVSALSVNTSKGSLTPVAGSPFSTKTGPCAAATDPAGKFLFVVNKTPGDVHR